MKKKNSNTNGVQVVNLTPHAINLVAADGVTSVATIEPSGLVSRVSVRTETVGTINGFPVTESVYGEVQDLPEQEEGTIYIVSALVAQRCKDRNDVFVPSEAVRDDKGRIIGCKSFGRV